MYAGMAIFSKAALPILMAQLLSTQAALGDTQLNEITTHSTAWTKTGQDTGMAATPLDSFQTMKTYPPDNSHPFRLDALTICIIGEPLTSLRLAVLPGPSEENQLYTVGWSSQDAEQTDQGFCPCKRGESQPQQILYK